MIDNYLVYNKLSGIPIALLKTDDPIFLSLNTPYDCDVILTSAQMLDGIEFVDVIEKVIIYKS